MGTTRDSQRERLLRKHFGQTKAEDATFDLPIVPTDEDFRRGKRRDPARCAYALACARNYHSTTILFFRHVAYLDLPSGPKGERKVFRFRLGKRGTENATRFDLQGEKNADLGTLILRAPSKSQTLDGMAKRRDFRRKFGHTPRGDNTKKMARRRAHARDVAIRNGSGLLLRYAKNDPLLRGEIDNA